MEQNTSEWLRESYIKTSIKKYNEYKDEIGSLAIFDDPEKVPYEEWVSLWNRVKNSGLSLNTHKGNVRVKDEEHELFYADELRKKFDEIASEEREEIGSKEYQIMVENNINGWKIYRNKLEETKSSGKDTHFIETVLESSYTTIKHFIEHFQKFPADMKKVTSDKINELFDIWEDCKIYKGQINGNNISKGMQKKSKKVVKIDKSGNIVATYSNRVECTEKENMNRAYLSQLISGKKHYYKGYSYKEID